MFSSSLDDLTWAEIKQLGDSGKASQVFSVGDKKSMTIKFASGVVQDGGNDISYSNKNVHAQIVAFNADTKTDGTKAPFTFVTEEVAARIAQYSSFEWVDGGYLREFFQDNRATILPSEVNAVICQVKKTTVDEDISNNYAKETEDYLFPPGAKEAGTTNSAHQAESPGNYQYFSSNSRRIKKNDGSPVNWATRSSNRYGPYKEECWMYVQTGGSIAYNAEKIENNYFPLGFCI